MTKSPMISAAAAVVLAGSAMMASSPAAAGPKFSIQIGSGYGVYEPRCYEKFYRVRVKTYYGWRWVTRSRWVCPGYDYY